jgi:hypothetical protein
VVKTCEYCGSEVPDQTLVCPNCAAHFDDLPPPDYLFAVDSNRTSAPLSTWPLLGLPRERLEWSFSLLGKLLVAFLALNFLGAFLGVFGQSPILMLALVLLLGAGYFLKKAL